MRSQKQTNKAPRPFKSGNATHGWGQRDGGFIPGQKVTPKIKKSGPLESPSVPETQPTSPQLSDKTSLDSL